MSYTVIFYKPARPNVRLQESFGTKRSARKWAKLVKKNNYVVESVEQGL